MESKLSAVFCCRNYGWKQKFSLAKIQQKIVKALALTLPRLPDNLFAVTANSIKLNWIYMSIEKGTYMKEIF